MWFTVEMSFSIKKCCGRWTLVSLTHNHMYVILTVLLKRITCANFEDDTVQSVYCSIVSAAKQRINCYLPKDILYDTGKMETSHNCNCEWTNTFKATESNYLLLRKRRLFMFFVRALGRRKVSGGGRG